MAHEVIALDPATEAAAEEATDARITDSDFAPSGPITKPAAYNAGTTYGVGAFVTDGAQAYRSIVAENKAHTPHEDDGTHWQPFSYTLAAPLQNPNYFHPASAGAGLGE